MNLNELKNLTHRKYSQALTANNTVSSDSGRMKYNTEQFFSLTAFNLQYQ